MALVMIYLLVLPWQTPNKVAWLQGGTGNAYYSCSPAGTGRAQTFHCWTNHQPGEQHGKRNGESRLGPERFGRREISTRILRPARFLLSFFSLDSASILSATQLRSVPSSPLTPSPHCFLSDLPRYQFSCSFLSFLFFVYL